MFDRHGSACTKRSRGNRTAQQNGYSCTVLAPLSVKLRIFQLGWHYRSRVRIQWEGVTGFYSPTVQSDGDY